MDTVQNPRTGERALIGVVTETTQIFYMVETLNLDGLDLLVSRRPVDNIINMVVWKTGFTTVHQIEW